MAFIVMRILEICPFSAGICGVWTRVKQEAMELSKGGNEVFVFSSNIVKGNDQIAECETEEDGIKIMRMRSNQDWIDKLITTNVTYFDFDKEFIELKDSRGIDLVITHLLHPHSFKALRLCKKYNIPCYLVTHAPFAVKRGFPLNISTKVYYSLLEDESNFLCNMFRWVYYFLSNIYLEKLNKFDKIIAITHWEMPFLKELGVKRDKIEYIPNGIPEEFFEVKKGKEENKILFFGRISPIKNIETLIKAFYLVRDKEIKLELAGPAENEYLLKLKELIKELGLEKRVSFTGAVYGLKDKIKKIDSARLFVLPSKREAMPQALIEVMAREKVVIASDNLGAKDIIKDGKNGFLFEIGNENALSSLIDKLLKEKNEKIKREARKSVEQFSWDKIIKKIEKVIES